jgi:hypothetical protein
VSGRRELTDEEKLQGKGASVGPAVASIAETFDGGVGEQLADDNAQVDTSCGDTAQNHWRDLQVVSISIPSIRILGSPRKSTEDQWSGKSPIRLPKSAC